MFVIEVAIAKMVAELDFVRDHGSQFDKLFDCLRSWILHEAVAALPNKYFRTDIPQPSRQVLSLPGSGQALFEARDEMREHRSQTIQFGHPARCCDGPYRFV